VTVHIFVDPYGFEIIPLTSNYSLALEDQSQDIDPKSETDLPDGAGPATFLEGLDVCPTASVTSEILSNFSRDLTELQPAVFST
jgi:hypothetical protein